MFEKAIDKVLQFTRPLHSISRTYGGLILPGSSSFFFVNDKGVAITCKHVLDLIPAADNINQQFINFKAEREQIPNDGKYKQRVHGLELKYKYNNESTVQLKNNFLNCFDKIEEITCHAHPTLDLAIMEFKGVAVPRLGDAMHLSAMCELMEHSVQIRITQRPHIGHFDS